jgi:hypothetical protein
MSKVPALLVAACLCMLGAVGATQAAVLGRSAAKTAAAKHKKAAKKPAKKHGLLPPSLVSPANGAHVEQVPTLTWSSVSGATEYEYQVAAGPNFNSIVIGTGTGKGASTTYNLAAALEKPVPDGTYYWRVRGLTSTKEPGAWSSTRTLVKAWTQAPQLLRPANGTPITWPTVPLVLEWTPVAGATEYIVTIATDPALSNIVLGSATSPQKTGGTVFALPGTLAAGQTYYWAITPVDVEGHRGARSAVGTFNWSWPTNTTTQITDLNPDPRVFEPQFSWAPVPGAAKYEVQVNSAVGFPTGSEWCCSDPTIGTSLTPTQVLANNAYYWRVRAIDASGNAGVWNEGQSFTKAFDSVTPTIEHLTMSDVHGNPLPVGSTTDTPIVTWAPVPGASKYEVQITNYVAKFGCELNHPAQDGMTSTLAWTSLGALSANTPYCVLVRAYSDHDANNHEVFSNWTQLGSASQPAFTLASQPPPGEVGSNGLETEASDYLLPTPGSTTPRTPLFTWKRVPGASSYKIVIARDAGFTQVVDEALTVAPAYAPTLGGEAPLSDETTAYYWAVVPVDEHGQVFVAPPEHDSPQTFNKSSIPPTPLAPINGVEVDNQPTFSWSPAEGALNYTLQVSETPSFGELIDNVKTDSTAYTSSSTYPADVTLYWRVRANDTNSRHEGLNWSAVQTFTRTLPVPSPAASTTEGQGLPVRSWSAVEGATAYNLHVELPNGSTKDFTLDSTSFTPTELFGNGIWHWEVRAEFPGTRTVAGGYFARQQFIHELAPPTGALGTKAGSRIVISWNPDQYAKEYEVDISTSDTFSSNIESRKVGEASWAPDVNLSLPANRGTLYWRVAAADPEGNIGPYATGSFVPPKPKAKCVVKKVKKGKKTVKVCVVVKAAKKAKKHG